MIVLVVAFGALCVLTLWGSLAADRPREEDV